MPGADGTPLGYECSTPCGITGRSTYTPPKNAACNGGLCSTPCGITGRSTERNQRAGGDLKNVLNALRHHREEHCARPSPAATPRRAQRLAASPGGARRTDRRPAVVVRCSTPCGITGRSTAEADRQGEEGAGVLNALRHHREEHRGALPLMRVTGWCSTPCGITGRSTRARFRAHADRARVLNALRHHREEHSAGSSASASVRCAQRLAASPGGAPLGALVFVAMGVCSTPCGITGRSTRSRRPASRRPRRAQRLAASPGGAPAKTRRCSPRPRGAQRLAASPGGAQSHRAARSLRGRCAQRLAASPGGALGHGAVSLPQQHVLNALRHHREEHLISASSRAASNGRVLNALRHHREEHPALRWGDRRRASAQRLAASPGGALHALNPADVPFGQVLNALRHHREEHSAARGGLGGR